MHDQQHASSSGVSAVAEDRLVPQPLMGKLKHLGNEHHLQSVLPLQSFREMGLSQTGGGGQGGLHPQGVLKTRAPCPSVLRYRPQSIPVAKSRTCPSDWLYPVRPLLQASVLTSSPWSFPLHLGPGTPLPLAHHAGFLSLGMSRWFSSVLAAGPPASLPVSPGGPQACGPQALSPSLLPLPSSETIVLPCPRKKSLI